MPFDDRAPASRHDPIVLIGTAPRLHAALEQVRSLGPGAPLVLGLFLADAGDAWPDGGGSVPVLGGIDDITEVCRHLRVRRAIVCLPEPMTGAEQKVRDALARAGVRERFLPTIEDVLSDTAPAEALSPRSLDFGALIGRPPRAVDEAHLRAALSGRRVLITGAGGSIGCELALRCAACDPAMLVLMDRSENALFEIDRRIGAAFPALPRRAVLHDIVDGEATLRRLVGLRPQVVLHAAAHKHVPMMEDHPAAAVNNNLFGTRSIADASVAVGVERFVMVSTDKAVNPTSVMGATKRLAEVYIRSLAGGPVRFSIVRFGNVLGSACSVLPIWGTQIREGGPLTVTHPEMTRFFMTIPEAASLVLQAGALDRPGADVFVLDMGQPVRIRDLAERFVRAHGLEPRWEDPHGLDPALPQRPVGSPPGVNEIRVVFIGSRPGEKLHEELSYQAEELRDTGFPGILAWEGPRPPAEQVTRMIADMSLVRSSDDPYVVLQMLQKHVPEMSRVDSAHPLTAEAA